MTREGYFFLHIFLTNNLTNWNKYIKITEMVILI